MRRGAAVLLAAAAAAGCGGAEQLPVLSPAPPSQPRAQAAGQVVLAFVRAARVHDLARLRDLMSAPTRASYGPEALRELADELGGLRAPQVVMTRRLDEPWGVAAVAARTDDGDPAAWAAALRREPRGWRIELGGVVFSRLRPLPGAEADAEPEIRVEAQSGGEIDELRVWLGARDLSTHGFRRRAFTLEARGRLGGPLPAGEHMLVAFASSGDAAGALAWPFEVRG